MKRYKVVMICFLSLLSIQLGLVSCGGSTGSGTTNSNTTDSIYPHSSSWGNSSRHGSDANSDISVCQDCHGSDLTGGTSGVSCNECHSMPNYKLAVTQNMYLTDDEMDEELDKKFNAVILSVE